MGHEREKEREELKKKLVERERELEKLYTSQTRASYEGFEGEYERLSLLEKEIAELRKEVDAAPEPS